MVPTVQIKKSANKNFSFQTFVKELFLLKQTFDVKRSTHEKKLTSNKRKKWRSMNVLVLDRRV